MGGEQVTPDSSPAMPPPIFPPSTQYQPLNGSAPPSPAFQQYPGQVRVCLRPYARTT